MPFNFDLRQFVDIDRAPSLTQVPLMEQQDDLRIGQATRERLMQRQAGRVAFDIPRAQAARGAFFSGATPRKMGRAMTDLTEPVGQARHETDTRIADLIRRQFMSTLGVRL